MQYNLACVEARAGDLDRAWEALDTAIELGYDDIDQLESDPDLEELRSGGRFEEILTKLVDSVAADAPTPVKASVGGN
jgi:hypothetical protein